MTRKPRPWYQDDGPHVLLYKNRKTDELIWAYTTESERRAAVLALFQYLDESWEVYRDLTEHEDDAQAVLPGFEPPTEQSEQRQLLFAARAGDADAAYKLLKWRQDYEYEEWRILPLQETSL